MSEQTKKAIDNLEVYKVETIRTQTAAVSLDIDATDDEVTDLFRFLTMEMAPFIEGDIEFSDKPRHMLTGKIAQLYALFPFFLMGDDQREELFSRLNAIKKKLEETKVVRIVKPLDNISTQIRVRRTKKKQVKE